MANLDNSEERLRKYLERKLKGTDKTIARNYANILREIRKELSKLYEKYEIDGKLTYAEMAKFDRLKKFNLFINELLTLQYKDMKKVVYDFLGDAYQEGYYMTGWAIETDTLSKLRYSAVNAETITAMIENPITGLVLSERLIKNKQNIIYTIQQELTQGLVQGETYGTMAKRLKVALENDAMKAMRIARTEGHRVIESAKHDSVEHASKNGIVMMKEWNSSEDERVRRGKSNHRKLNGVKVSIEKEFDDGLSRGKAPGQLPAAGSSINCRCFLTYEVVTVKKPDAKDLDGMVFDTWKRERVLA